MPVRGWGVLLFPLGVFAFVGVATVGVGIVLKRLRWQPSMPGGDADAEAGHVTTYEPLRESPRARRVRPSPRPSPLRKETGSSSEPPLGEMVG